MIINKVLLMLQSDGNGDALLQLREGKPSLRDSAIWVSRYGHAKLKEKMT